MENSFFLFKITRQSTVTGDTFRFRERRVMEVWREEDSHTLTSCPFVWELGNEFNIIPGSETVVSVPIYIGSILISLIV